MFCFFLLRKLLYGALAVADWDRTNNSDTTGSSTSPAKATTNNNHNNEDGVIMKVVHVVLNILLSYSTKKSR